MYELLLLKLQYGSKRRVNPRSAQINLSVWYCNIDGDKTYILFEQIERYNKWELADIPFLSTTCVRALHTTYNHPDVWEA